MLVLFFGLGILVLQGFNSKGSIEVRKEFRCLEFRVQGSGPGFGVQGLGGLSMSDILGQEA